MTDAGFSGVMTAKVTGISYRQLDYWARTELIRPSLIDASGCGSRRSYSYRDLLELKLIKRLLDGGVDLKMIRQAFSYIRENLGDDVDSANVVIGPTGTVVVRTDGELVEAARGSRGRLCLMLSVGPIKEELDAEIVAHRGEL